MTTWKQNLVLFVAALVITAMAWGQGANGNISGNVSDASGAAVAGAAVIATDVGTGVRTTATTNEIGLYRFVDLPPGMYTITVEAKGFRKTTLSAQRLVVATPLRMDVTLEIGEVSTSVTVESIAALVNTEDAQLGETMTQVDDLPILSGNGGRNALTLVGLQPGVTMTTAGSATTSIGPFAVNGQRTQANNFMLDGADSNDLAINVPDVVNVISPNALGEFRVVTGAMKAEYGRDSGAIVESTIKSGANGFHGELTEIFRNKDLNANNFFSNEASLPRPQYISNDFDANLGGADHPGQNLLLHLLSRLPAGIRSDQHRSSIHGRGASRDSGQRGSGRESDREHHSRGESRRRLICQRAGGQFAAGSGRS